MNLAFHHEDAKSTKCGVSIFRNLRAFVVNHLYPNSVPFAFPIALSLSKGAAHPAYLTVAVIPRLRSFSGTHFS